MDYKTATNGFFPIVIIGETIDKKLYDHLNSYTAEKGSDGVVRVAAANLNYRYIRLKQNTNSTKFSVHYYDEQIDVSPLELEGSVKLPPQRYPIEVLPRTSHSGKDKGIMYSVTKRNSNNKPVVKSIIKSLMVNNAQEYEALTNYMLVRTTKAQYRNKYTMLVVRVKNDQGNDVSDFDLYILAGKEYSRDKLPKGFFVDRQKNKINPSYLTYYLNWTKMRTIIDGKIGFRVVARPKEGFAYYSPAEFRSEEMVFTDLLKENESLLLDIELKRHVDINTFRVDPLKHGRINFKKEKPSGDDVK